ncbi:MAG: 16S rRNA (cytosine(1402)-N(4))-methyltransferase RsmH [Thermoanaerobaculia bacterium]
MADNEATNADAGRHAPVLLKEVIALLRPGREEGTVVDATVGLGGHAEALLKSWPRIRLLGIDRDPDALAIATRRLEIFGDRVTLVRGRHEKLIEILKDHGITEIDALLADLGVSSLQFDEASRGFSFRAEGPLDMRMGQEGESAADVVNRLDETDLADLIWRWGEEPMSRRIARAIVAARAEERIETTMRLAEIVRSVKRRGAGRGRGAARERIDPATLTFQALRIAVNEELVGLESFVENAVEAISPGGRIAVISFHSLEDRIVKRTFRRLEGECICPPRIPLCRCGAVKKVNVLTRKPVEAGAEETASNPRARSARLRVAEKVEW